MGHIAQHETGVSQMTAINLSIKSTVNQLVYLQTLFVSLQIERGEWLQFQADLQVAVSVADRLRAEAEEELTTLRTAHKDLERELAAARQRQKEADVQLSTLRVELKENQQRLATLSQAPCQELERPNLEPAIASQSKEIPQRGRERGVHKLPQEVTESRSQNELTKNDAGEKARTDSKGVTRRYLRNVTNEDSSGEELRSSETRRIVTTERSR